MDDLKKWLIELTQDTIIAAVITLLWYILGIDKTWNEAFQTFFVAFAVMFFLGIYNRRKNKQKE